MAEKYFLGSLRKSGDGNRLPSLGEIGLNRFAPHLINLLAASYNSNLQDRLKPLDMTTAKMRALSLLTISAGLTVNELSFLAVIEQSTMSRTLDSLEEQGYVRRQSRSDDMRVREIHITEAGRIAFQSFWPTLYGMYSQLFDGIDADEYDAFVATLHKILRNMHKHNISDFGPGFRAGDVKAEEE
jgi:MarR family transcriptional regulator for hemolysin